MGRSEIISVDSYVHVLNRGAKKMLIYRQKSDLWRLMFNLFYMNSESLPEQWARELSNADLMKKFVWPKSWDKRKPIISIVSYTIMPNHFHLVLKEITDGGISQFMHKFTMSYSKYINFKYKETGSLFQGRFKSITSEDDSYLKYLISYVMVKNTFELYPGGLKSAINNFDKAYEWATNYPFSSLGFYALGKKSLINDNEELDTIFDSPKEFKEFSRDCISGFKFEDREYTWET